MIPFRSLRQIRGPGTRVSGYGGLVPGEQCDQRLFRPIDTFRKRFNALLREIKDLGFQAIDLWMAHLHWAWATKDHTKIANSLIAKHGLKISSMAGNWGENRLEFEAACRLANAIEVRLLTGSAPFLATHREWRWKFCVDTTWKSPW